MKAAILKSEGFDRNILWIVLQASALFLNGCAESHKEICPLYSGRFSTVGWHTDMLILGETEKDVTNYIRKNGESGWIAGLTDSRPLPGEQWKEGHAFGNTPARVKDLFFAIYQHQRGVTNVPAIPDNFDPKERDKEISEALKAIKSNSKKNGQ